MKTLKQIRRETPCSFNEGITFEEFHQIAILAAKHTNRIKSIKVEGPIVYVTAKSQTGYSTWDFQIDFNNWGHITGVFWEYSDNADSYIPYRFGIHMSSDIHNLLSKRGIHLPDYSELIDNNKQLETATSFSYKNTKQIIINTLFNKKIITMECDSNLVIGEHIYYVISWLKKKGFNNVTVFKVDDVDVNSSNYHYQVAQIVINHRSYFEKGDVFSPNDKVFVTYHTKRKICLPHMFRLKRKNYKELLKELWKMGFSNTYTRKIQDLVTGILTPQGSVEKVLVEINGQEVEIERNQLYEYDTPIIVEYHTFK